MSNLSERTVQNPKELNKLLSAAIINPTFCQALLKDPTAAIENGYLGHRFGLTAEEVTLVSGIRAKELQDFAGQIAAWISHEIPQESHWARLPRWEMA